MYSILYRFTSTATQNIRKISGHNVIPCSRKFTITVLSSNVVCKQRRWLWSRGSLRIPLVVTVFIVNLMCAAVCPRRPISPNKTTLSTDFSFYIYQVVFDELLKETGHGSRIIVSKYPEISHCN